MGRVLSFLIVIFIGFIWGIYYAVQANGSSNLVRVVSYMKWLLQ